jgi:hypothetical protein
MGSTLLFPNSCRQRSPFAQKLGVGKPYFWALTFSEGRSLMIEAIAQGFSIGARGVVFPSPAGKRRKAGFLFLLFMPDGKKHG